MFNAFRTAWRERERQTASRGCWIKPEPLRRELEREGGGTAMRSAVLAETQAKDPLTQLTLIGDTIDAVFRH